MEGAHFFVLIAVAFATAFVLYQFMSLNRMQSEMSDMREEIERLQDQIQYELQDEDVVELDITVDESQGVALPMLKFGEFDEQLEESKGQQILQFEDSDMQLWHDPEGRFRVKRDTAEAEPELKKTERRSRSRNVNPHCMHFALNHKKVTKSKCLFSWVIFPLTIEIMDQSLR